MKCMNTGKKKALFAITPAYVARINKFPLRPILNAEDNDAALLVHSELMDLSNRGKLSIDERAYYRVLGMLIQDYERKALIPQVKLTAADVLEFLMDQHGLKQVDLIPALGSQASVSFILNSRRLPTREQISNLAELFQVSPALFFA